jgi:hemolysin III
VPAYSAAERRADAILHVAGVTLGLLACLVLAVTAMPAADLEHMIGLGLYGTGLMAMLGCSALYHLTREGGRRQLFRRFDHAAIFLMIAGTYTPFLLIAIDDRPALGLLGFVWLVAIGGMGVKLLGLRCPEGLSIACYLLLGWSILVALGPLSAALSPAGIGLLAAGGMLYSLGVVFHLWRRLPYHNAVWHAFVLAAAACHYAAVLRELAAT